MGKPLKDHDPLYYMGQSINGMSREALIQAVMDLNKIAEDQKTELYKLRAETQDEY